MAKSCQGLGIGRPRLKVGIRTGELYHKLSKSPWEPSPRSPPCLCTPGGTAPFLCQQRAAVLLSKEVKALRTWASGSWPLSILWALQRSWSSSACLCTSCPAQWSCGSTDLPYSLQPLHLGLVIIGPCWLIQTLHSERIHVSFWVSCLHHGCSLTGSSRPSTALLFLSLSVSSFPSHPSPWNFLEIEGAGIWLSISVLYLSPYFWPHGQAFVMEGI